MSWSKGIATWINITWKKRLTAYTIVIHPWPFCVSSPWMLWMRKGNMLIIWLLRETEKRPTHTHTQKQNTHKKTNTHTHTCTQKSELRLKTIGWNNRQNLSKKKINIVKCILVFIKSCCLATKPCPALLQPNVL